NLSFDFDTSVKSSTYRRFGTGFVIKEITQTFSLAESAAEKAATVTLLKPILSVESFSGAAATISWTDNNENVDGFNIFRGLTPTTLVKVGSVDSNVFEYNDEGLISDTVYFYSVEAFINDPFESVRSMWKAVFTFSEATS